MPRRLKFPDRPRDKEISVSVFRRILNFCCVGFGAALFVLFMPFLIISFIVCSSANALTHDLTGGYLLNFYFRSGEIDTDTTSTDSVA